MATLKGPLFSLDARGTIGGAVVYSIWKGRNYARRHAVPANPKSGGQLSMRSMLKFLTQAWTNLTPAEQTDWETRAAVTNISPFNAFVSYNMTRWGINDLPSQLDPAAEANVAGLITAASFTATAQSRAIGLSLAIGTLNQNWGVNIFRGSTDAMGITRNELVQTIPAESAATFTWLDFPLTVGVAVYYRCYPFSDDGVIGAAEDDITATPTA